MLGKRLKTEKGCPECGSKKTVKYSKTGDVYCRDCDREYSV